MWEIYHSSPLFDRELRPCLKLPDKGSLNTWFEETVPITVSRTRKNVRHSVGFIQCAGFGLCVKEYLVPRPFVSRLLDYVRPHLRRRHNKLVTYERYKNMFDLGIPAPEPYACLYQRDNQTPPMFTYIVISQQLESVELRKSHHTVEEKQQLFSQLGRIVANMHKSGYVHKDLHQGNIMVNEREIFLIDLDKALCLPPLLARRLIIKDLTKFVLYLMPGNPDIRKDTYIASTQFFAEYCKISGMELPRLLTRIYHRLRWLDMMRIIKNRTKLGTKRSEIRFKFAYGLIEYVTKFSNSAS